MLKTWDIFDTLIARRGIFPQGVFQIVEQIIKADGFVQARMVAEKNVSLQANYVLDDIYNEFQKLTGLTKNICDAFKKLECDVELEQCIPITENLRQVKAGDILISDMYLPEELIRKMLHKAGLLVPVEIVITSGGKSSGRIWKQLADQKEFVFHIGDNQNTDVKNPRLVGFESALSILNVASPVERFILQKDFNFGAYLREIRLRNPFSEEIKRLYWEMFTTNIGILILFVQQIDELQKRGGFEYLGFCGRDTHYMRLLYEKYKSSIGEAPVPNDYLYYSRKLVCNSGAELAKYFNTKINGRKALMIDLFGTGVHLHNLREIFNVDFSILICLLGSQKAGQKMYPTMLHVENWTSAQECNKQSERKSIFLIEAKGKITVSDKTELLNRATHNSPVRLKTIRIDEKILPEVIFSEINDTENFDVFETCLREVLNSELVLPSKVSGGYEEILLTLFSAINSFQVSLPLRNNHDLSDRSDSAVPKYGVNIPSQKK